jgi:hypothetical protein
MRHATSIIQRRPMVPTLCVASTGAAGIGSSCQTTSNCAVGLSCWGDVCRPYCSTAGLACSQPGTGQCEQEYNGSQAIPNATVCEIPCTLDDLYSCGGGTAGCVWLVGSQTDCEDLTPYNTETCTTTEPLCAPGYVCLATYECAQWCQVDMDDCGGDTSCYSFNPAVVVSGVEYGFCQ